MSSRHIATSTLWQLGSQAVTLFLGILSIKFVTTALSQSLVGNYQTVYSYLQIFGILADFGLYAVAVRELSRSQDRGATLGSLFVLRSCITVIALSFAVGIAWLLPGFHGTPLPLGISIAVLVPFFVLLSGMLRTLFQVTYRMHFVFLAEVCSKFVPVCLIGLAILLGAHESEDVSLYYAFLVFGGAGSLTLFLLLVWFARGLIRFDLRFAKGEFLRIARLATPYGLAFFATTMYRQSDVTLIALLRDDYDIQNAYYGTVLRLAEIGFLLPTFLLNSALPVMSGKQEDGEDLAQFLGTILLNLLTLGSIVSLFAFLWAKPIILLVARESYLSTPFSAGSDTALSLLSAPIFLSMIVSFCFYVLLHSNSWRMLLMLTTAAAFFSVGSNRMLIPDLGFVGAGYTSIMTHLLLASGLLVVCQTKVPIRIPLCQLCLWFAFSVTLGLSLFALRPILTSPFITVGLGLVVLCGAIGFLLVSGLLPIGRGPERPADLDI
jgi:O-antigen/teichoic acid export membrane protein